MNTTALYNIKEEASVPTCPTCSFSDNTEENRIAYIRSKTRKSHFPRLRWRKYKTKAVYNKLMKDVQEIEELGEDYVKETGEQLPGVSILEKIKDLVHEYQSLYFDSDEHYLMHLPNGNVKMRFSKGDKSWSLYVSDHHVSLIILDYIDEVFSQEFPIGTPTKTLVEISSIY